MTNHNNASKTSDEEEFVERLEKGSLAYISESGPVYNGPTWAESKAAEIIKRLVAERDAALEEERITRSKFEYRLTAEHDRAEAAEARIAELKVTLNRVSADRDRWYKAARLLEAQYQQAKEGE